MNCPVSLELPRPALRLRRCLDHLAGPLGLAAVGLTAAVSRVLADAGISANVIAGFTHDHLFVPHDRADDAIRALAALAASS